jgi:peroxiredoxin Q/BCP
MEPVQPGDPAPAFTAPTHEGQQVSLADYLGRQVVVLFFYPRDGTPVCTQQACAFRDAYEAFLQAGAVVLGVSSDSPQRHQEFAASHHLPFPLLADAEGSLRRAFGVPRSLGLLPGRVTYVIDREGIVRHVFQSQFQADRHVREALRIVRALAGEPPPGEGDQLATGSP